MKSPLIFLLFLQLGISQKILIPMDDSQKNHLKAYGLSFWILEKNTNVDWLLNYRGGAFMVDYQDLIKNECILRGISYELVSTEELINIYSGSIEI